LTARTDIIIRMALKNGCLVDAKMFQDCFGFQTVRQNRFCSRSVTKNLVFKKVMEANEWNKHLKRNQFHAILLILNPKICK